VQSFFFKNSLLKFLQINVSLNYNFTCYVVLSCVRRVTSLSSEQRDILTTTQHVARSTTICMFDDLASEQRLTCLTMSKASNARVRHVRQRAKRAMFDMFDNKLSEQGESSLVYIDLLNTTLL